MAGRCCVLSFPLFLLLICRIANCQAKNGTRTTSVLFSSYSMVILSANQTTISRTIAPKHPSSSIKPSTSGHVTTSASLHVNSSRTQVPSHTTVMASPTPGNHSTTPGNHSTTPKTPTTKGKHPCPSCLCPHDDNHGKWIATGFAILFLLTTVVMTVLFCRQRKIYRELEGDSSLSRLI